MVFLAALVPLAEKVGAAAPLGRAVATQVYFRVASPPASAPRTASVVMMPVTGLGVALAGVATVGAGFTVTEALAENAPLAAVTVPLAEVLGAVSRPPAEMVPTVVVQVKLGWVASTLPNWSLAVAANCWVPPTLTVTDAGLTAMLVSDWFTTTFTLLVVVNPAASAMVTVNP